MFPSHMFPIDNPFLSYLGVEFVSTGEGAAELALTVQLHHMNRWQVTHGGISMTMLDVVMARAGRSLYPQADAAVTVEMKTSCLQPAGRSGARLVAKGKAFHQSTAMCFCDAQRWHGERLVANAMGTLKYIRHQRAALKIKIKSGLRLCWQG